MPEIRETSLPGVGLRHDFRTRDGRVVGVVTHRTDRFELFIAGADDPDSPDDTLILTDAERHALAELLGGSQITEHLSRLQHEVEGLAIDWLPIPETSSFARRTIGDTRARTRTGVSIVALLRDGTAVPAPGPEQELQADDTLVVVGTPEGIQRLAEILGSD